MSEKDQSVKKTKAGASSKAPLQRIDCKISKGTQSLIYSELGILCDAKVRIEIKSDSYAMQSFAHLKVWSNVEQKWSEVSSVHFGSMQTRTGLIYEPRFQRGQPTMDDEKLFKADRDELIRLARAVLS